MRALNQARVAGDALQCSGPSSRLLQQAFSAHADPMTAPGIIAARALRQPGGRSITTLAANLTGLRKTISFGCGQAILPFVIAASREPAMVFSASAMWAWSLASTSLRRASAAAASF